MSILHFWLICILFILKNTLSQHGCNSGGSCALSSDSSYINSHIYCTENVDSCSIHCRTGYNDGCRQSSIWLSGTTNTLTCDATQTCQDVTVYCGYPHNSVTPPGLSLTDFDENMVTECNVICSNFMACSALKLYCNGNTSLCSMTASNSNAFRDGLFECNNNDNIHNQCNTYCSAVNMDCAGTTMNCNDMKHCSCTGDGCTMLQINSKQPTSAPTNEPTTDPTTEPTNEPTTEPTNEPTIEPTANPTTDPITELPIAPTTYPIPEQSIHPTSTVESGEIEEISSTIHVNDNLNSNVESNWDGIVILTAIIAIMFIVIIILCFMYYKRRKKHLGKINNTSDTDVDVDITHIVTNACAHVHNSDANLSQNDTIAVIEAENDYDVDNIAHSKFKVDHHGITNNGENIQMTNVGIKQRDKVRTYTDDELYRRPSKTDHDRVTTKGDTNDMYTAGNNEPTKQ